MKKLPLRLAATMAALVFAALAGAAESDLSNPNVIVIYTDDLGYGDVGCFGATDIQTPHIDRMAREGIRFTDFYSASSVCTPSRAALLTGRFAQRMGIVGVFFPESFTGMPTTEYTMAEMLRDQGYATGIVGKWHLGHHHQFLPLQRGFDEYFGIPYSNDMASVVYLAGNEVAEFRVDQTYTTRTYTEKAISFIERHEDGPFFLYLAHNMPHVPIYASPEFQGSSDRGLYGDVIQEIDWSVGEILHTLEQRGLLENTLVVFTSDNGPWEVMRDHGGSPGKLREGKMYTFEGGMRVPTVAMWPAGIKDDGRVEKNLAVMTDWMVTLAEITGATLPDDRDYDGESLLPVFQGTGPRTGRDEFIYYNADDMALHGYRRGDWKIKLPYDGFSGARWKKGVAAHPLLLINLRDDPGETNNLATTHPDKAQAMLAAMNALHANKGPFPEPIPIRSRADNSHFEHLTEQHGEAFWDF
ncbi:sulfatase family protein [Synoicihabitans lomoniglobus]|uniref:Sulfatase n=1 Tax=Synoicihabitans lomoniglobus TaxID=2909285 RepID=A0AAE9ZZS5_9BACT|nr:sulfatase [Opitutaceae bacterium LMO-M01]WED64483.1 sulfatase [Opitutaceae bacterium LMO-M01]